MTYQTFLIWIEQARLACGENQAGLKILSQLENLADEVIARKEVNQVVDEIYAALFQLNTLAADLPQLSELKPNLTEVIQTFNSEPEKTAFINDAKAYAKTKKQAALAAYGKLLDEENLEEKILDTFFVTLKKIIASKKNIDDAVLARAVFTDPKIGGYKGQDAVNITRVDSMGIFDEQGNLNETAADALSNNTLNIQTSRINNQTKQTYLQEHFGLNHANPSYREAVMVESIIDTAIAETLILVGENPVIQTIMQDTINHLEELQIHRAGKAALENTLQYALENLTFSLKDNVHGFEFNDAFVRKIDEVVHNVEKKNEEKIQAEMKNLLQAVNALSANDLAETQILLQNLDKNAAFAALLSQGFSEKVSQAVRLIIRLNQMIASQYGDLPIEILRRKVSAAIPESALETHTVAKLTVLANLINQVNIGSDENSSQWLSIRFSFLAELAPAVDPPTQSFALAVERKTQALEYAKVEALVETLKQACRTYLTEQTAVIQRELGPDYYDLVISDDIKPMHEILKTRSHKITQLSPSAQTAIKKYIAVGETLDKLESRANIQATLKAIEVSYKNPNCVIRQEPKLFENEFLNSIAETFRHIAKAFGWKSQEEKLADRLSNHIASFFNAGNKQLQSIPANGKGMKPSKRN